MTATALEEHFRRVADAAPIPILIYAVPQYTGITVTSDLVTRLSTHSNIVGIKESSGNVQLATEIVGNTPPEFRVLVGSGSAFSPSLAVGVAGGILALACFLPEQCIEIYDAATNRRFRQSRQHPKKRPDSLAQNRSRSGNPRRQIRHGRRRLLRRPLARPVPTANRIAARRNRRSTSRPNPNPRGVSPNPPRRLAPPGASPCPYGCPFLSRSFAKGRGF